MTYGWTHPLDVDLADLASGAIDPVRREELEAHLSDCLLCRIKLRRLREALSSDSPVGTAERTSAESAGIVHIAPGFLVPAAAPAETASRPPFPGAVWAAGDDERLIVLVVRTVGDRVLVAPVTFDALSADDETVVVDSEFSPFDVSLAVYPMLAAEIPVSALATPLGTLVAVDDVDHLLAGSLRGTSKGQPISGPSDPRLEFRQMLIDHFGRLEDVGPDPDTTADAPPPPPERIAGALAQGLRERRGEVCKVRRLAAWDDLVSATAKNWAPIVTVDEVGTVLVVFDTPAGLANDADFVGAIAVLTRYNASAVVVLATTLSPNADVFDAPSLSYAWGVPSGARTPPRPVLSEMPPADVISKFLEEISAANDIGWFPRGSVAPVDVLVALSASAGSALADVVRQGRRARIVPKTAGYGSAEGLSSEFIEVLRGALSGQPVAERLSELAHGGES